jgi:hypothetical protein
MSWVVNTAFELDLLSTSGRTREAGGSIKPGAQAPGIEIKEAIGAHEVGDRVT